ncbi:AraC family transcriptional regulator [Mesorhizobium sp. B2-1-8]|uniref:helix-turn-helix transcriptional regulator n=1 Tax=Mesorhizobium sp. B2-1-8 TaxID=2589967 RepID=UPI0015E2ACDE|nr:AraC family transcriptional regulator [Mesorhizobium sp. B2-1-8]UCI17891.1 AraC family transcriptional regulator [Mesorhizobium sp. B2-1-8]
MNKGTTSIFDLRRCRYTTEISPFRFVHFKFPRPFLNSIAEQEGRDALDHIDLGDALRIEDPIFAALGDLMETVFLHTERATSFLIDDVSIAAVCHVVDRYCSTGRRHRRKSECLSAVQMRRASEILDENLPGTIPLSKVASECNLPPASFRKAFKESFGALPSAWLERRRIDRAMKLLQDDALDSRAIAMMAGFRSCPEMKRVFAKHLGQQPGWFRPSAFSRHRADDAAPQQAKAAAAHRNRLN